MESDKKIFLSYSQNDGVKMRLLNMELTARGLTTWTNDGELQQGILHSTEWMEQALKKSKIMVVLCSPSAKESESILKEIHHANHNKVSILPVLIDGDRQSSIPTAISKLPYYVDARESFENTILTIQERLQDMQESKRDSSHPEPRRMLFNDDDLRSKPLVKLLEDAMEKARVRRDDQEAESSLEGGIWDAIHQWISIQKDSEELVNAICSRGDHEQSPLHLLFQIGNPPKDILYEFIKAAPEVVRWKDRFGWLPLHHASAKHASLENIEILIGAFPEAKLVPDGRNRTPLHFCCTAEDIELDENIVKILSDTGATGIEDQLGMLPLHYACAYCVSISVLEILLLAYPESLIAKDHKGRTCLHFAMSNAHRDGSPDVVRCLLDFSAREKTNLVNMLDAEDRLPINHLALVLEPFRNDERRRKEVIPKVRACIDLYLAADPEKSPVFHEGMKALDREMTWDAFAKCSCICL